MPTTKEHKRTNRRLRRSKRAGQVFRERILHFPAIHPEDPDPIAVSSKSTDSDVVTGIVMEIS